MGNRISSSILTTKDAAAKFAIGAASFMLLTVVGSATIAGATPVTGTTEGDGATSLEKNNDGKHLGNEKGDNGKHLGNDKGNHHTDRGNHGYGGGNNAIHTGITVNQNGNNNVFTAIFNYFFG